MKTINDYAELVKEKHALNKTIAPVETDLTDASRGYHIGEQFINNGELFKAKTEIAQHDALVLNTNYEPADDLTTQIKNAGGGTGTDPRLDVFENNIAPVETDETDASKEYQVGEQLILNNILYDVIAPISEHDVITTTGSGANIAPADPLSSQFQTLTNQVSDISDEIADMNNVLGAKNLLENQNQGENDDKVVVTRNSDGSVTITTNGEVENEQENIVLTRNFVPPVDGQYKLTGGYSVSIGLIAYDNVGAVWLNEDTGSGAVLTLYANRNYNFYLIVRQGTIISTPITISPMLRPNKIADDTYVPYSMTNREMTPYVQAISNPNLLDNPWFTVNQRNFSSSNSVGYTVDRWHLVWNPNGCTVTKNSDGLSIDNTQSGAGIAYIFQKFETKDLVGKMLTASILLSDGSLLKGSGIMPQLDGADVTPISDDTKKIGVTFQHSTTGSSGLCALRLNISEDCLLTIKAVKLELGSVSTLAMDTAPNYATELLKCQRYYQRFDFVQDATIASALVSTNWASFIIPTEKMRITPSKTITGTINAVSSEDISSSFAYITETAGGYVIHGARNTNGTMVSGYYSGGVGGVVIELSAEL